MIQNASSSISLKDLYAPLGIIFLVFLLVWFLAPTLDRDGYVVLQSDAFIELNYFLNKTLGINHYVWSNITYLGNALVLLLFMSFLILYQPRAWAAIFGSIPLAGLFSSVGKSVAVIPRPATVLEHDVFIIIDRAIEAYTSLPSGHSITIFCLLSAAVLSFRGQKNYKKLFYWVFGTALILVLSRIAVGAHWPLDVVVGAALGYIAGLSGVALVNAYKGWWIWIKKPKYFVGLALLQLLLIGALLNEEHSVYGFSAFNGVIWLAVIAGFLTVFQLLKGFKNG